MAKGKTVIAEEQALFKELSELIEESRQHITVYTNNTITILFWRIGRRINESILNNKRADYGKQIVVTLSRQLTEKYGKNFEEKACVMLSATLTSCILPLQELDHTHRFAKYIERFADERPF